MSWNYRPFQWELQKQFGPENDPDKRPPWEPGDKYIIIHSTIGSIIGGIVAGVIGVVLNLPFFHTTQHHLRYGY